ncbi:MAG: xanthine dehydrogenase family protein molybdopterin-binding subunit [Chloroflexota bacterium]|jgi:CO/xanthine dehydrogenase Mo-binding subunit|nr:xanthine dehydrogenase family protein molybdopterin-binding subunit [Chloroflexota bacterium]
MSNQSTQTFNVIGSRPVRHDGADKVTGRAIYANDVRMSGLLHAKMLRSPHAHAKIISIDTRAAEAYPGVKAVLTASDLPDLGDIIADLGESTANLRYVSENILARSKVLYHGHAIAAVAATSISIAEEACKLIRVEYELLPAVLSVKDAAKADAPILLHDLRTEEGGAHSDSPTNIAKHIQHQRGDVEKGFAEALEAGGTVVEREFWSSMVHQGYIEPHAATALWSADGNLTIWCSTQGAFSVRSQVSKIVHIPESKLKIVPTEIGGGFGGKIPVYLEPVVALLSKKAGYKPVQMAMTRADVLMATGPTSGSWMKVKIGANKDGIITAATARLDYEAGAFPGSPVGAATGTIMAPYKIDNLQIDGYDIVLNKPKSAAYRAPGATNAAFAFESVVNEVADNLGIDPLEFRRINAPKEGDRRADGPTYMRIGCIETIETAIDHPHNSADLGSPAPGKKRGRGAATGFWFNWGGKSSCTASVNPDGSISLVEGSTDIGGTRTSISMQLAEVLGIPVDQIRPMVADTDSVGYNDVTGGSRTTFGSGLAAYEVGQKIKQSMIDHAAKLWEIAPDAVTYDKGVLKNHEHQISFKALSSKLHETGGQISATVTVDGKGGAPAFATHIVDVEVDEDTGKVDVLRYTAIQDVGKAIHPSYVEGQMHGGAAQGIGWALNEEYVYDANGKLLNSTLLDYRMPTTLDLPMIEARLVEVAAPNHPFGVRGVGEVAIVPPVAAIANAIHDAIGVRMTTLPMSPVAVLKALGKI